LRLDTSPGWRDPIISYLKNGTLLDDKTEAQKLRRLVTVLLEDLLYKKSYSKLQSDPYLRRFGPEEARRVMQEMHDGDCGNHAGGLSLAHKAINQGFYWPKMFDDAREYVKKCPQCQRFVPSNRSSADLHTLRSHGPFMQ